MKYSGIGGQAVIEGIMMKNKDQYATAVRRPDGEIAVSYTHLDVYKRQEFPISSRIPPLFYLPDTGRIRSVFEIDSILMEK